MLVSVVIPTLNEEKNIGTVVRDTADFLNKRRYDYEIIIVDGYSADKTVEIAKKHGAKIIFDDKGKGSALKKGMNHAKGSIVITMDADCSHTAKEMGLLIEGIEAGFDVCMGSRFLQGGGTADMPFYRRLGNKFFVRLVNLFWKTKYSDLCYGYRSFSKKGVKLLETESEGFGIEAEIAIKAAKSKLRILEVPSFEKARNSGAGKLRTFRDGWVILKTILKEVGG
ncbi:MAG: glycosyltransferase family 2 protein [Candidatus Aenigmarchaeota archaeon]|nr:glycosyltransferase family 2 protein [Candidatus Aenigmarchaeota archaeon]